MKKNNKGKAKSKTNANTVLNEVGGAVKKEITFHLNHYVDDAHIYEPIIERLLREGWKLDNDRCREEFIGNYIFRHRWVSRIFPQEEEVNCFGNQLANG